jgi:hypothetical protein
MHTWSSDWKRVIIIIIIIIIIATFVIIGDKRRDHRQIGEQKYKL